MELEIIMLNEIRQTQKDKYYIFSVVCRMHRKVEKRLLGRGRGPQEGYKRGVEDVNMIKVNYIHV
jgi:hypothetical protein